MDKSPTAAILPLDKQTQTFRLLFIYHLPVLHVLHGYFGIGVQRPDSEICSRMKSQSKGLCGIWDFALCS